jgi:hypothetical protein
MSHTISPNSAALLLSSARRVPRSTRGDGWNVLADIEVFVFAVNTTPQIRNISLRSRRLSL